MKFAHLKLGPIWFSRSCMGCTWLDVNSLNEYIYYTPQPYVMTPKWMNVLVNNWLKTFIQIYYTIKFDKVE